MNNKKTKAIISFSGGLDSLLAIKILESQGIECLAVTFATPFFSEEKAKIQAEKYGINIRIINISENHFEIVKNPKNGYGKNMNPCIDCHGFMFSTIAKIAENEGYDIIASGEVVGQRGMSQNREALLKVKKIAGMEVLRPLCAKNLEETEYEKKGLVDRNKLFGIGGRGRKIQMKLAEDFGLKDYASPGGGCLLTTIDYSKKLKDYISVFGKNADFLDAEFLKHGREKNFEIGEKKYFAVMGRNQEGNEKIFENFIKSDENYFLIKLKNFSGPNIILNTFGNDFSEELEEKIIERFKEKVKKISEEEKIFLEIKKFLK